MKPYQPPVAAIAEEPRLAPERKWRWVALVAALSCVVPITECMRTLIELPFTLISGLPLLIGLAWAATAALLAMRRSAALWPMVILSVLAIPILSLAVQDDDPYMYMAGGYTFAILGVVVWQRKRRILT